MNLSVEAQNIELAPQWREQLEDRLNSLSDPRDPVISARSTFALNESEIPPADVRLVVGMKGKNIVVHKKGDNLEAALKTVLDTAKREIRRHYELRTERRTKELDRFSTSPGVELDSSEE